jgi:hypothetical protein
MAPDASNLQHLVSGRGGAFGPNGRVASARKLQILAPNALKSFPRLQILPPSPGEAANPPLSRQAVALRSPWAAPRRHAIQA